MSGYIGAHEACRVPPQGSDGDSAVESRLAAEEAEADRSLLRLFQAALKAEKLVRALDLAACLVLPLSLEGALRLARHHKCAACPALLPERPPACLCPGQGKLCKVPDQALLSLQGSSARRTAADPATAEPPRGER